MSNQIVLAGLDGSNPLGFLAALGVLRVLDLHSSASLDPSVPVGPGSSPPLLGWTDSGAWRPVIVTPHTQSGLTSLLMAESIAFSKSRVFSIKYPKLEKNGAKVFAGLKIPRGVVRAWLFDAIDSGDFEALRICSGLFSEACLEPIKEKNVAGREDVERLRITVCRGSSLSEATVPTHFDFTTRNTQFIDQVEQIRCGLCSAYFDALFVGTPLTNVRSRSMGWDPFADAPGALFSESVRGGSSTNPATEWLAFRALANFPCFGLRGRLETGSCTGSRKRGRFTWPLWDGFATPAAVRSLLSRRWSESVSVREREELGVVALFESRLTKAADGYTGVFAPCRPV
jgi:hypothetical protein